MKFSEQMEFEFKELKEKIQKLKQIEMKLNTLNVEGFDSDTEKIESKLKKPPMVDEVEIEFNSLERKILEKKEEERKLREEEKHRKEKERIAEEEKRREDEQKQRELENLRKEALEQINAAKLLLGKAKKLDIPELQKEEQLLATAQNYFDIKEYATSISAAQQCKNAANRLIEKSKPNVLLNLPQRMQYNFWKFHDIILTNNGTANAKNITIHFPKTLEIRELKTIAQLDAGKQQTIHVNIKPTEAGDVPIDYSIKFSDLQDRIYESKHTTTIQISTTGAETTEMKEAYASADPIEIKRGYSVLENKDIKFGIRITNNSDYAIMDADSILDYSKTLFSMQQSEIYHLGNINPKASRTATYILKPLACTHFEKINAIITYKGHTGKKHILNMRPKEVPCVSPILKEKQISESQYSRLVAKSEYLQEGITFKGISIDELAKFMCETWRYMLYKVKEYDVDGSKVIYLSGESIGEKAYYLLTAVIREYKGLTQVVLQAHSDNKYGLHGFMKERTDSIRLLVGSVQNAKEIGIIENTQVINIIDSVVQRTSFNMGEGESAHVHIKESVVQRPTIGASARKCPNCGREVEANEKFCLECGAKL